MMDGGHTFISKCERWRTCHLVQCFVYLSHSVSRAVDKQVNTWFVVWDQLGLSASVGTLCAQKKQVVNCVTGPRKVVVLSRGRI